MVLPVNGHCPECNEYFIRLRKHSAFCIGHLTDFFKYLNKISLNHLFSINSVSSHDSSNELSELPFYNCSSNDFKEQLVYVPKKFTSYIERLKCFKNSNDFTILHLNINSINSKTKQYELNEILKLKTFDIIVLNETKLDESTPASFLKSSNYGILRRDRNGNGGGVMVLEEYKIINSENSLEFESILLKLNVGGLNFNFLACYKSPSDDEEQFIDHLETAIFALDPSEPLFIIGDLNMNLLNKDGKRFFN